MRFDSLLELRIFSLSQARDKKKNILLQATCCYQKLRGNPKTLNIRSLKTREHLIQVRNLMDEKRSMQS